jgi:CheY-like chemotaxis protein
MSLFGAEHDAAAWPYQPSAIGYKPLRGSKLASLLDNTLTGRASHLAVSPKAQRTLPTFRGRRILLVEDNPVNQRVAQRVLEKLAAEVTTANNGAEALERIAETDFDVVLMDCQMPVMDGFTATRRIRAAGHHAADGRRLPIIALTANVMSEDREQCLAAGMDAHLGKPLEPSQLADCLGRYLNKDTAPMEIDLNALHELTGGDAEFERRSVSRRHRERASGERLRHHRQAGACAEGRERQHSRPHPERRRLEGRDRRAQQCGRRDRHAGAPAAGAAARRERAVVAGVVRRGGAAARPAARDPTRPGAGHGAGVAP